MSFGSKGPNPLIGWQLDRTAIRTLGRDLQRPECILAERDGTIWTADARGGVMKINPDGSQQLISPFVDAPGNTPEAIAGYENRYIQAQGSLPNGLCLAPNGSDFIIANWGTNALELMTRAGHLTTLCTEIDGLSLGKANFPLRDSKGRIWFTVTTRTEPWSDQINTRATDGYIALLDEHGVRIVADGFCGTNEIRFDPAEAWLYVVESTSWRISRLRVQPNGTLTDREVYGPSRLDGFPDGFAFDAYGNLWVTLIFTDQLIAITPDGDVLTLLDESNPATKQALFTAYENRAVTPDMLGATMGTLAPWLASLTFGGPDLQTVYLGSLRGTTVPYFRSPVAGQPMIHW
ncbi:SMP-30/gluconolactonase/LRE family protein [Fibrella aquatilis]|uniref:SMP-30/gluconolactonase/LRE family protein n=1 Tax=Fibrella aquatilis TaxID=2817059 RepID=A0A939G4P1_9BACT|nr:SMP-30/gluconolactonase/LRE family protein [Fibrella aquatilis]MBO0929733.1 SMP-30/gluconolactonase/LRE family protein [Fibrella aquatilis]